MTARYRQTNVDTMLGVGVGQEGRRYGRWLEERHAGEKRVEKRWQCNVLLSSPLVGVNNGSGGVERSGTQAQESPARLPNRYFFFPFLQSVFCLFPCFLERQWLLPGQRFSSVREMRTRAASQPSPPLDFVSSFPLFFTNVCV